MWTKKGPSTNTCNFINHPKSSQNRFKITLKSNEFHGDFQWFWGDVKVVLGDL